MQYGCFWISACTKEEQWQVYLTIDKFKLLAIKELQKKSYENKQKEKRENM